MLIVHINVAHRRPSLPLEASDIATLRVVAVVGSGSSLSGDYRWVGDLADLPLAVKPLRSGWEDRNDGFWHKPDLQRPLELGPIMAALPTFGAECLVIAAFQTWRRGFAKVGS